MFVREDLLVARSHQLDMRPIFATNIDARTQAGDRARECRLEIATTTPTIARFTTALRVHTLASRCLETPNALGRRARTWRRDGSTGSARRLCRRHDARGPSTGTVRGSEQGQQGPNPDADRHASEAGD